MMGNGVCLPCGRGNSVRSMAMVFPTLQAEWGILGEALSGRHAIAATQGAIDFGSGGELIFLLCQQALLGIP